MNNLNIYWNKLLAIFPGESVYLNVVYKAALAVAGSFIVWMILKCILNYIQKRAKKYNFIRIDTKVFIAARRAVFYALVLVTGTYLIRIFNIQLIEKAFFAFLIILLAAPVKDFLVMLLTYLENNIAAKTETKIDNIIFDLLNKFAGVIVYLTAIILALDILGVNVMPFIAGAGVIGIAIGFAAKDTLSNLIAGVLLIIDRPFEIGDRIEVWNAPAGSASWGDVIGIGLRATKIRTTDNIVIIIPNNEIMTRDIVNYTIITSKIRVRINIGVAYDADMKKTKEIIKRVADSADWISKEPPPNVVVKNFGESSVDLQLRVWIDDARKRMDTISYITDRVKDEFDKEGIEIPYPKRDIIITDKRKASV
ncbi:MAG: mechanosensitive ion channel family protein [Desulfobacteraceae bacterium]|uniref:Mechanosensitive ion channel family protein n=1 Tax=Candidatus Desulfaltia bathyphila TaxID=2841697 RepID=A0A8J6N450_9BACT|nr:mechanosensitive ion channel family protein [Candidatus Desulfaltia bathyphila]MBL7194711.1 mechanosensitive ion channel family protein [Desulfobacterales bacterium]